MNWGGVVNVCDADGLREGSRQGKGIKCQYTNLINKPDFQSGEKNVINIEEKDRVD